MSDQDLLQAALRSDLGVFIHRAFLTLHPGGEYLPSWHVDAMAYRLMQMRQGALNRLIITVPPRHLKSISCSVAFPAWLLGLDPTLRMICASYSLELASRLAEDTRRVMRADWYQACFPETQFSPNQNSEGFITTTANGYRLATSVGGSVTGLGADIIVIDDPHKADEAQSEVKRKAVIDWYRESLSTRLNHPDRGGIVLIQQRFHEEDLAGFLLQ
jgi:hypothetical protein